MTSTTREPVSGSKHAVLVTGASGGIGRAISLAFAAAGWSVGVHYHRNKTAAEDTLAQVVAAGGAGALYEADICESQEVQQMVEAARYRCRRRSSAMLELEGAISSFDNGKKIGLRYWLRILQEHFTASAPWPLPSSHAAAGRSS